MTGVQTCALPIYRHAARGYSGSQFRLSMTRQDIGSYLGLKLETVSRLLASLSHDGLLEVDGREITLKDFDGLRQIGEGVKHCTRAPRKKKAPVTGTERD